MITTKLKTVQVEVTETISCDNCKADIPLVFPDPQPNAIQGRGMLKVEFSGRYGEYVDGNTDVHLCSKCADGLRGLFPLFDKVLSRTVMMGRVDWRDEEAWTEDTTLVDDVIDVKHEAEIKKAGKRLEELRNDRDNSK